MLIITTLALLMAATMGWMAVRLLREEQRRSDARVAALTAALDTPDARPAMASEAPAPRQVPPFAAGPQIVALDDSSFHEYFASADTLAARADTGSHDGPLPTRPMFGSEPEETAAAPRDDRRWLAPAAALLVTLGIAGVWWTTSDSPGSVAVTASAPAAPTPASGVPVELVALGHERTATGLVIRGLVRNPAAASTRAGIFASVFLFDETGGFVGSGRSVLDAPSLTPGSDAAFEITLPGNAKVRRYRVTFRAADGTVVPHLDRRQGQV